LNSSFPFESRYARIQGFEIHYVEQGPRHGSPILFFHGNPTSSYMWRDVIPPVAEKTGRRVIAFDLLGFGKSSKPTNIRYSLKLHSEVIEEFISSLKLKDLILVGEDWERPPGHVLRHSSQAEY
jgi:haloalkane dehalogenase